MWAFVNLMNNKSSLELKKAGLKERLTWLVEGGWP